jgi:hypothetical protein
VKCELQNKEEKMTHRNVKKDIKASNIAKLLKMRNNNEKNKEEEEKRISNKLLWEIRLKIKKKGKNNVIS